MWDNAEILMDKAWTNVTYLMYIYTTTYRDQIVDGT